MRAWVLYVGGRDWRQIRTCVEMPADWVPMFRARQIADGGYIVAVYREKVAR